MLKLKEEEDGFDDLLELLGTILPLRPEVRQELEQCLLMLLTLISQVLSRAG